MVGMVVAFAVSLVVIKFLMGYIKNTISKCLDGTVSFLVSSCYYADLPALSDKIPHYRKFCY